MIKIYEIGGLQTIKIKLNMILKILYDNKIIYVYCNL